MTPERRATAEAALADATARHVPVLCDEVVEALAPQAGEVFLDGTFGAGGYARALLDAADCRVIGLDRDRDALTEAEQWAPLYDGRLSLVEGTFGSLDESLSAPVNGIVLDIGVSSMQLDRARRGFSFLRDGPLDMRMSQQGTSAADLVNAAEEGELADIFFQYGEERRSRALARAVVDARRAQPIETTGMLAAIIEQASPPKKGQAHPATRVFQALRIAVNDELGELARGLAAAERVLGEGGRLAVVTFHSLEDRIVKRFFQQRAEAKGSGVSRYAPDSPAAAAPSFEMLSRKPIAPGEAELDRNPRARSAKLRAARRTAAPAHSFTGAGLGLPRLAAMGGTA